MKKIIAEKQSEYGLIQVEDRDDRRYLLVNHEMESAVSLKTKREILFPYMRQFSYAFSINPGIRSCLLIGGGACSYPLFYLRNYPENTIDVVEISRDIIDFAGEYFYLDTIESDRRFGLYNMDASLYFSTRQKKYDLIINDAFIGREEELRKAVHMRQVYDHLYHDGVYLINLVSAVRGPFSKNLKETRKAMLSCFKDAVYLPCSDMYSPFERQNLVLAASDRPLP